MLSKVQHKNLLKFIGACKAPIMVIVTKLLTGGTLRKYLVNMRPRGLDTRVALGFALDIARTMECLHAHGIIHRDLKPDHKCVKLADFGLAREGTLTEMMTAETETYCWMAPELYSTVTLRQGEKKHYNHKVDAYSFAIVLWELIHNKMPFEGMSNLQTAYAAALKDWYASLSTIEGLLEEDKWSYITCKKCTRKVLPIDPQEKIVGSIDQKLAIPFKCKKCGRTADSSSLSYNLKLSNESWATSCDIIFILC